MIRRGKRAKKRIISLLISMCMVFTAMPGMAFAETEAVEKEYVYTSLTGSTTDEKKGNGTATDPYNRFETAVKNVKDGGTIYIKASKGAFINGDEYGRLPYVIDKKITVMPEKGADMAELSVRAAGIVLNADVEFKNIRLDFGNKTHDAIFANGHKLTLINVSRSDASREIDLFAGGLCFNEDEPYYTDKDGNNVDWPENIVEKVEGAPAANGVIEIRTDEKFADKTYGCSFGNIYAGSMNGTYTGSADIIIDDSGSKIDKIEAVYARGAREAVPGNMFDFSEPAPPSADAEEYAEYYADGDVSIELINQQVDTIDGFHGTEKDQRDLGSTSLAVSTKYRLEHVNISDVDKITAENGTFAPKVAEKNDSFETLTIKAGAELDLSCRTDWSVKVFNGTDIKGELTDDTSLGSLTLAKEGSLHITDSLTGTTRLNTAGGIGENSGIATADHIYIASKIVGDKGEDSFIFTPNNAQPSYGIFYTLNEGTGKHTWSVKIGEGASIPKLESFIIVPQKQEVAYEVINDLGKSKYYAEYDMSIEIENADEYVAVNGWELAFAAEDTPFTYEVVKDGIPVDPGNNVNIREETGRYITRIPTIGMELYARYDDNYDVGPKLIIQCIRENEDKEIEKGVVTDGNYEITMSAEDKDGNKISQMVTLTVLPKVTDEELSSKMTSALTAQVPLTSTIGERINIPFTITKSDDDDVTTEQLITEYDKEQFSVYVNGKETDATIEMGEEINTITASVDVTPENGFEVNTDSEDTLDVNKIMVVFDGNGTLTSGITFGTIKVDKGTVTLESLDEYKKEYSYDGKPHPYEGTLTISGVPEEMHTDIKQEISYLYRQIPAEGNESPQTVDNKAPVYPGEYEVLAVLPEGELYEAVTEQDDQILGTITIEKAIPRVTLTGTISNGDGESKELKVKAEVGGAADGIAPWGNVYFSIRKNGESTELDFQSAEITYGEATHTFLGLNAGQYTITATYMGNSTSEKVGENDVYLTRTDEGEGEARIESTSDFTVAENHISVTGIQFTEKEKTIDLNGTTAVKLTVAIEPSEAIDKTLFWQSGDEEVVAVDGTGMLTPKKVGNTYISVLTRDGGYQDTCFITVKGENPEEPKPEPEPEEPKPEPEPENPECTHSYTKQDVTKSGALKSPATCTTAAVYYKSCDKCDEVSTSDSDTFIDGSPVGHKYGAYVTTQKAGFGAAGTQTAACSACQHKLTQTIPAAMTPILSEETYTYDGKVKSPTVVIKDANGNSISSADYTITMQSGRKNVGTYMVTIEGKGDYTGTITKSFNINPNGVKLSKLSKAKKSFTAKWKKPSSTYRKQMTGYQIRYSTSSKMTKAKTVTVKSAKAISKKISKLKAKKKYYVQIRTYKTVKGVKYYSGWSAKKSVKTK